MDPGIHAQKLLKQWAKKTWVQFPAPVWQLIIIYNSSFREPGVLVWRASLDTRHTRGTQLWVQTQRLHTYYPVVRVWGRDCFSLPPYVVRLVSEHLTSAGPSWCFKIAKKAGGGLAGHT